MAFCTIVEFEWDANLDRARFEGLTGGAAADGAIPEGRLARIAGIDDSGARVVEMWRSGADARAFAERSASTVARMPAPSRVVGFEVTAYDLA